MISTGLAGLGFGLSLIIAIGAQNAYVLRQGLRREHVLAVVCICMVSDVILITAGVAGFGTLLRAAPWLVTAVSTLGAAFLLGYAALAARRAVRPMGLRAETGGNATGLGRVVLTSLALTWLNPHVYLDTVLLLGAVAGSHGDLRWAFGVGAIIGSVMWFSALGGGARYLRPLFARPAAWRVLDGGIALVMTAIALSLLLGARMG